jgi:signal transduction histidine kinase
MSIEGGGSKRPLFSMRPLLWAAIGLPIAFLASIDVLRHTVFSEQLHTIPGFIGVHTLIAIAVVMFSYTMFGLMGRLQRRIVEQNTELRGLLAVGKVVTASLDLDELLKRSLDTLLEVTSLPSAAIWLRKEDDTVVLQCHRGAHPEAFSGQIHFSPGEGLPGLVAQRQDSILIHDLASDTGSLQLQLVKAGFKALYAIPLRSRSKLMGVLAVAALSQDALKGERNLRLVGGIAEWLGLAIDNARLYQQVQDTAVLQERERIAREMHDGMAQVLGYVNTQAIAVKKFLSNGQVQEAEAELARLGEIARDLYGDVREGILGLRIAGGRQQGLLPAVRQYVERYMEMCQLPVEVMASPESESVALPLSTEIQLIRIIQEALANVRKHARATAATVSFEGRGPRLAVTIADNGQGFDLQHLPVTGWPRFGLRTMRERAEAVGGTLSIETSPGRGTRVQVFVPAFEGNQKEEEHESPLGRRPRPV